jgi:hypothetical protein
MEKKYYHIRVTHELGFYSFYDVEAYDHHDAERKAIDIFITQFCSRPCKYRIEAYTFNK